MGDRKLLELERDGRKLVLYGNSQGDRELYIDGIHGVSFSGVLVKMNLYTTVPFSSNDDEERREVVARVVMSIPTFVSVVQFLSGQIDDLIRAGIIGVDNAPASDEGKSDR